MTLQGTNTYVVRAPGPYVIDPGPADDGHLAAVRECAGDEIEGVLLTHSHADHSAGVTALGAPLLWGKVTEVTEWAGHEDVEPAEPPPTRIGPFECIPTPGHARDHVAFGLGAACFCGDLVLGEGSSIVLPRGGGLGAYLDSLERLRGREFDLLCPGHGPFITDPRAKLDSYREHRLERERLLVAAIDDGVRTREGLLDAAWGDVPEALRPAAALAMDVHLEKLADEGALPSDVMALLLGDSRRG